MTWLPYLVRRLQRMNGAARDRYLKDLRVGHRLGQLDMRPRAEWRRVLELWGLPLETITGR